MHEARKTLFLKVTAAHHSDLDQQEGHSHAKAIAYHIILFSLKVALQLPDSKLITTEISEICTVSSPNKSTY